MVHPAQFLPICEQTGLIVPVGAWVLRAAAEQAHRWHEMHPALGRLTLNVNLSARQIAEPDLVASVARILKETHLDPTLLRVDITEDLLVQKLESTLDTLRALRDMGLRLGLDGFGTGYTSLSHLHRLPIEYLQIDRSFVQRLETDEEAWEIARLMVTMARHLGLRTIATGVETREQANLLRTLEVDSMQGYLFSRPVDADRATALLEDNLTASRSS
jgi:EAL domain-containing protein (putative c-di-GMP-specific phosphodiesterase class I)